eukprot:gene52626-71800_t
MGLFETLLAWLAPDAKLKGRLELRGVEHLDAATADGSGVLLLTGHFTTLEIAARSICLAERPFHAMYRPADNAFVDWWNRWYCETQAELRQKFGKDSAITTNIDVTSAEVIAESL